MSTATCGRRSSSTCSPTLSNSRWKGDRVPLGDEGGRFASRSAIPAQASGSELPRIFERFHRVEGARARTHEGTGIGLALVQELAKLHGGSIDVESTYGSGTTVTVRIPDGTAHLPPERIAAARPLAATAVELDAYVDEAVRAGFRDTRTGRRSSRTRPTRSFFLPRKKPTSYPTSSWPTTTRICANMSGDSSPRRYRVRAVGDGEAALAAAKATKPDLVLTDVMMPTLDGFGLLKGLRTDPTTATIPVLMLCAGRRRGPCRRARGRGR